MKKKSIKKISNSTDFYDIFNVEKKVNNNEENFEELFKATENDPELKKLIDKRSEAIDHNPISIKERIKSYPHPQSKLDLHGSTSSEAELLTEKFINGSINNGLKTVRVITGKGHHSFSGPVLRDRIELLANVLKKNKQILGWNWEKKIKEKSGSIIFYLF